MVNKNRSRGKAQMALTPDQRDNITLTIKELNGHINDILDNREDIMALMRLDLVVPDAIVDVLSLVIAVKQRAKVSADALVALLG